MHPETKHGSVEDKPRDDTGRIQSRQNGETGTDRVTKDTIRSRERCQAARTSYLRSPTRWVKGAGCRLRRR
jgi:hypothetical protein